MFTKEQITERITYLKSISPAGGYNSLFQALEEAVEYYFTRDDEFKKQATETFKRVKLEIFFRAFKCDRMDLFTDKQVSEYPVGYVDVMDIFNTEVFNEMMSIDDTTFRAAFYTTSTSESGSSESMQVEYHNSYIENWTASILATIEEELGKLKALEDFCYEMSDYKEDILLFEEVGRVSQPWNDYRQGYAHVIYIQKEWDNFNTMFEIGLYEPSYIEDLRNGVYSEAEEIIF